MTGEQIKSECEKMYLQIKTGEERLRYLRSICKHKKTFIGNYSFRIGNTVPAEICEYCNELIKII